MAVRFRKSNDKDKEGLLWCKQMGEAPFVNRWFLQDFANYIVRQYGSLYRDGFRVSKSFAGCCRTLAVDNNALLIKQAERWAPYKPANLFSCKGRTCVICGYKLALGDVAECLRAIGEYAYSAPPAECAYSEAIPIPGRSVIQICLTCSHEKAESLDKVRKDNMRARKLFWDDRKTKGLFSEIGMDAMCIANESPYGDNGWAFHPHIMAMCHTAVDLGALESELTPIWQDKVAKVGRRAITGPCLSVDGGESIKTYLAKQAFELAFGNYGKDRGGYSHLRTPFHILYDCAGWYHDAVRDYGHESKSPEYETWLSDVLVYLEWMDVMRGTRFFRWSPQSKNVFPWLSSDEKKVEEYNQNGKNIISILNGRIFWRSLSPVQRFQLQRFGIRDDVEGLKDFVSGLGFEYVDELDQKEKGE